MVFIVILELLVLFFLSRTLTQEMSLLFHKILKSRRISVWLIAIIFLPGTIIHEFSHALSAKILFVHVGKMELMPSLNGESLKLGSVEVGKTDIFRNFLIGIAPFVIGVSLLLLVLYFSFTKNIIGMNLITGIVLYFIFVVANTMYSSKKDMEGAIEFLLLIVSPVLLLYFFGVRIPGLNLSIFTNSEFANYIKQAEIFLALPLILDIAVILFAKIATRR
jgi:hypothetical protein